MVIQLAKTKPYGGKITITNALYASKILINPDIPEVVDLKKSLKLVEDSSSQRFSQILTEKAYSIEEDFLLLTERKTLDEIREAREEGDDDSFPRELDVLVKKKFLFKIQVSEFNLNQNWPVFSVSKMTDDENLIAAFRDSLDLNQESIGQEYFTDEAESSKKKVDLDNVSLSVTCDNEVEICSSDNITPCKRNLLESDLEHSVSMDLISPQLSSNKKQKQIKIEKEN
ncbi:uncharacterized protein LOC109832011 isoform X1 [Asparagus officinalis]|uniref:uncharacterized protein LOC109832011 isoform X1 n=1 Tax=Asparagus officinalis TaxID=4686 RepID=UPI00098E0ED7|nr:uncharacterized protein LOC109832011 isoform X1 [Asparagus officinalis]